MSESSESSETKTATRIRCLSGPESEWRGTVWLYRLDPPYEGAVFVVSSAVRTEDRLREALEFLPSGTSPLLVLETLVFEADEDGHVQCFVEIGGGTGYTDCDRAITEMGYRVVRQEKEEKDE